MNAHRVTLKTRISISFIFLRKLSKPSYFHTPGSEPLRAVTVGQLLDEAALKWPERKALISIHEKQQLTFAEAKRRADQLGAGLLKMGVKPGDRVATFGGNTVHWYLTALAAAQAGFILTGLNPNYQKDELFYSMKKTGVKAIVADTRYKATNCHELLSKVVPTLETTATSSPVSYESLPDFKFVILATDEDLPGTYKLNDVQNLTVSMDELDEVKRGTDPDKPFNIQFTAGTTGNSKAAVLSHFGVVNNAHFFGKRCGFDKQHSTICHQVPFFHVFGTILGIVNSLDHGITLVLPGIAFNKNETIKALTEHKCTAIYGTPAMYTDVSAAIKGSLHKNEELKAGLENLNIVVSGGALCSPELFTELSGIFKRAKLQSAYGMSETSPVTFTNSEKDSYEQRTGTVGCVAEHQEVKVVDEHGKMVPFGTPGEVCLRGYSTMMGYWEDERQTGDTITPTGWLKSGDQLVLNEDGYGKIVGRLKEQINRGGEKIMPSEIELLIGKHSLVQEVYVLGVSDQRLGEEICACVKLFEGAKLTEEDIKLFCKGKIPRYVRFMDEFPRSGVGKVQKFRLRERIELELKAQLAEAQ